MKSIKLLAGIFAGSAFFLTGCQEEFKSGEDSSKPVATDLRYDVQNSKPDTLAFCWNATNTINAGATSYGIEVCDSPDDAINTYDDDIQTIKVSQISKDDLVGRAVFTNGISEYTEKYVRIRVNYGAVFSAWTFAKDSEGNPALFVTGHGIKDTSKPAVESISLPSIPESGTEFSVKADLSAVASASRVLVILMDYTSQTAVSTITVDPSKTSTFETTFTDLRSGKLYQVKMLAEYDSTDGEAAHVSEWTYAEGDAESEEGETVKTNIIQSGKGFVIVNGIPPTTRLKAKYSGMLVFQWSEYGFANVGKDIKIPVKIALYGDADCKNLVYGWTITSDIYLSMQPSMTFANLTPGTKYWFTCQDMDTGLISDPLEAETSAFDIVMVGSEKVAAGKTVLAEDFGQLYFGSNSIEITPSAKNSSSGYVYPTPGKWDSATLAADSFNHGFFNTIGSSGGVQTSRFKDWAVTHEVATTLGDLCIRTGMLQVGASSSMPIVFTPELNNLQGLATVNVTYTISSMWEKGVIKEATASDFTQLGVYTATGGSVVTAKGTSYGTMTGATVKNVGTLDRPSTTVKTPSWETRSVNINNVAPGTRIGIGAIRPDGKTGNQRFLLREVVVKVVSYGIPTLTTPILKSQEIGKTKASFVFEAQSQAQSYKLGYKKNGDATYTYIESETPEFNLTGLTNGTQYIIKVTALAGGYESETPFYEEFKTESVSYTYPMTISNVEDFVEWMQSGADGTSATDEITLAIDLDLKDVNVPAVSEFNGILNGNGKSIKNWSSSHALFDKVNGTIMNLKIDATCTFTPEVSTFAPVTLNNAGTLELIENNAAVSYSASEFASSVCMAGIAAQSSGTIKSCTNNGKVTLTSANSMKGVAVGGIAGYSAGEVTDCTNNGDITLSGKYLAGSSTVGSKTILPCEGGLVGVGATGFKIENGKNYGSVTFLVDKMESATETMQRICFGGIAGAPDGDITNSNNYGKVSVKFATSSGAASTVSYIPIVGGISGGDWFATSQNATNITGCTNEGEISLYNDSAIANSALGGIVGWPGVESTALTIYTKNSVNKGAVTFSGVGKCRLGGVQGGTGNMENCTNEGAVISESGVDAGCVVGSLCGFHSQGHKIITCNALGSVTAKSAVTGLGGLIGNIGNAAHTTGDGCTVNCTITGGDATNSGAIAGYFNGTSKVIKLGTTTPIKVAGSINGTVLTESNYTEYLRGSKNTNATNHVIGATFGE